MPELAAPCSYAENRALFAPLKSPKPAWTKPSRLLSPPGSGAVRYPSPPMSEPQPSSADRPEETGGQPPLPAGNVSPAKDPQDVGGNSGAQLSEPRPMESIEPPQLSQTQSHPQPVPQQQLGTPSSQLSSTESIHPQFQALSGAGRLPGSNSGEEVIAGTQLASVTKSPSPRPGRAARRTKAHVPSACVNCKRAHLSCDVQRPCTRCVTSGKQDTCYDVQHKKRGRPRLRDRADTGSVDVTGAHMRVEQQARLGTGVSTGSPSLPQPEPFRVLRAREARGRSLSPHAGEMMYGNLEHEMRRVVTSHPYQPPPPPVHHPPLPGSHPVAFMNLDLVILRSNRSFQDLISRGSPVVKRDIAEFVDARQSEMLQRLRAELREEKEARDPTYMPPIFGSGEQGAIDAVPEHDLDRISAGFVERQDHWTFLPRDGPPQNMRVLVRLARTTVFFATLLIIPADIPRPHSAYSSHPAPKAIAPPESSPRLPPVLRGRDSGHFSRPSTAASDSPPPPYYTSPTITSSLPPTPHQHHQVPYGRSHTPGSYSPAYPTTLPPPIPHSSYVPIPLPMTNNFDRPASRHSASSSADLGHQHEPRLQYQLPPLRSGTPQMSPPTRPPSSWTPRSQQTSSSAAMDTPTSAPTRSEPVGPPTYGRVESRQYSSPPGDDTSSGSGEGPNKRRRLTIGIHELTD